MSAAELGNFGEFIGAIAVVISVIYLGVQIHRNTKQLRRAEIDSVFDRFSRLRQSIYENSDLAKIFVQGMEDPIQLEQHEAVRYFALMDGFFVLSMQIWGKSRDGVLGEEEWSNITKFLKDWINTPGGETWWTQGTSSVFHDDFRDEIEKLRVIT